MGWHVDFRDNNDTPFIRVGVEVSYHFRSVGLILRIGCIFSELREVRQHEWEAL